MPPTDQEGKRERFEPSEGMRLKAVQLSKVIDPDGTILTLGAILKIAVFGAEAERSVVSDIVEKMQARAKELRQSADSHEISAYKAVYGTTANELERQIAELKKEYGL